MRRRDLTNVIHRSVLPSFNVLVASSRMRRPQISQSACSGRQMLNKSAQCAFTNGVWDYCVLLAWNDAGESGNNAVLQYHRMIIVARCSRGEPFGRREIAFAVSMLIIYTIDYFGSHPFNCMISKRQRGVLRCHPAMVRSTFSLSKQCIANGTKLAGPFSAKKFPDAHQKVHLGPCPWTI